MKVEKIRYTKKDVKKAIKLTKRRLRTFTEHTGLTYAIDEEHFLNMPNRKEAVRQLELIKWSNVDKKKNVLKYVSVFSINTLHGNKKTVELFGKEKEEIIGKQKRATKVTGEEVKVQIFSEKAKEDVKEFFDVRSDNEKWGKWKSDRNKRALNNFYNNVKIMGDATSDPALQLVAQLIKIKVDEGLLTASTLELKKLYEISSINLFDSEQTEEKIKHHKSGIDVSILKASAGHILQVLREGIPITDEEIIGLGLLRGMELDAIKEIL